MYSDWTTTFFNGLAVELWVKIAPPPTETEIEFLRSIFGDGGELLDVACGAGRFTIPLSHAGYSMTGVDLSDDFLRVARHRGPAIAWHRGDVRELPWRERFDGALCFGNSFGYFPRPETRAFLRGVAAGLKPGATFVLETGATAESLLPSLQLQRTIEAGEITFSSAARYDAKQSILETEYTFAKGDVRETKPARTWIFTAGEVAAMLADAGFAVEDVYASAARDDFILGSPRAIFVARRK
ncbi:MAG TPA: class I SAM-dependent methyltransferase [Thermoanaerobaculia bacterium]|nr:class I SAM-dependent methyltransferase [Thermoanaerobaculia bacterium]